ncbi:MAG: 1-(5-phosphoribosyl)-5-[Bacteroidales bacterium]|nr:1-(5-phosphoribosyl)-5-[(5-phosphoribosylamino)methylideneamino]imidazole-4-carboxamide isomerase [Bacteroidales bacterium]
MIQIVPAIDLIGGRCARLSQGDFNRMTSYTDSPAGMVSKYAESGVRRIHVVDLDGARMGRPENLPLLRDLASAGSVDIEWGGGIKSRKDVEAALEAGAGHVICGTMAVKDPELFMDLLASFGPDKIILGADVRGLEVATRGWTEGSGTGLFELVGRFLPGLAELIVTDISRDGMFTGPAVGLYSEIMEAFPGLTLTASGGVGSMDDIARLDAAGVPRVIVGKAIYENKISMEDIRLWSQRG